jgi:LuxR family transcriptional regulator, maltose regulon positive regulatory protein
VSVPRPRSRSGHQRQPASDLGHRAPQLGPPRSRLPVLPQETVPRPRIVEQLLSVGDEVAVVLVIAPAGYGKTIVLRQWASESAACVAWLQILPAHNDPARLLADVALALEASGVLGSGLHVASTGAVRELVARVTEPVLLVLDDIDTIDGSASLDLVADVVIGLPAGSHVALSGRVWPGGRVAQLRHDWRFAQFDASSLRFTQEEGADLLRRAGVWLDPDSAAEVVTRTEGWAAGLHLAAGWLRGKDDVRAAVGELRGDLEPFVQYFDDVVLAGQPADVVSFLLRTSALDRFTAALCDAVLGTRGSGARLGHVRALNLFTLREEEHGTWFRYHALFRQMLQSELRRREPDEDLRILARAAQWYQDQGDGDRAIEHALAAGDELSAARLIVAHAKQVNSTRGAVIVRRWIDALREETLTQYPPVAVIAAWAYGFTGDAAGARRALRIAESAAVDESLPDGQASMASAVALARATFAPDGVETMLADAETALALLPPGTEWQPVASFLVGVACVFTGDDDRAVQAFERAARYSSSGARTGAAFALAQRALLAGDQGDWIVAEACARESLAIVQQDGIHIFGPGLVTHIACARVALHRGESHEAWENAEQALDLYRAPSPVALPWLAAQTAIEIGRTLADLDDVGGAARMAAEARRHLAVLESVGTLAARLDDLTRAVVDARHRVEAEHTSQLTPAEIRVLRLLPTHLSLTDIANELVVSRNTVKSQVAGIYHKLGASGRRDAVRKADDLGLLRQGPTGVAPVRPLAASTAHAGPGGSPAGGGQRAG